MMFQSVVHMLFATIDNHGNRDALRFIEHGQIRSYTYREFGEKIKTISAALHDLGINAGDKVAIISNNRPEWTISDFAIFSIRGVVVPLYQTLPANQIEYILNSSASTSAATAS